MLVTAPQPMARQLLQRHHLRGPVDLPRILRAHGIELEYADLSPDVAGLLMWADGWVVVVNRRDAKNPERFRFTLAHELGHYFLHRRLHPYRSCRRSGQELWERHANQFAAELLMPEDEVRAMVAAGRSFGTMAARFGVSLSAMHYRLKDLDLVWPQERRWQRKWQVTSASATRAAGL